MYAVDDERGAHARMSIHEGVLLIELKDLITAAILEDIATQATAMHGTEVCGFILDFRSALLAATAEQLDLIVMRHPQGAAIYKPGAFVSNDEQEPVLRAHAISMARCGMYRKTFDDTLSAHDWVRLRAQSCREQAHRGASALR